MALFKYSAVDPEGLPTEGSMEELSAQRVTAILHERGFQVNVVEEQEKRRGFLRLQRPLTWEDLDLLNEQLVAITTGGLPLAPSLRALTADIRNRRLKPVLEDIRNRLEAGASLEEAISRHPDSFSPIYISIVRAGECAGNLSGVLSHLSAYSSRMVEIKNRLQEAVAYPILVLIASCGVLGFLLFNVGPVFAQFYRAFGVPLPWITRFWLGLGALLRAHVAVSASCLVVGLVLAYTALKVVRRSRSGRYALDWLKLHLPGFGGLFFGGAMARFSRSLGLLLVSDVPAPESIDLAGAAAGNTVLREAAQAAARSVAAGSTLAGALGDTGVFGHSFCWMLATGEERGEVDTALFSLADSYERDVARKDTLIGLLTGPVLIIVVGAVVLSLILSVYYPVVRFASMGI